jgi:hypothetical protein
VASGSSLSEDSTLRRASGHVPPRFGDNGCRVLDDSARGRAGFAEPGLPTVLRNARSIHLVETRHLFSHAEAKQILRRAGFHQEHIDDVLRDLPDPIDIERDADTLVQHGVSREQLINRIGGSP